MKNFHWKEYWDLLKVPLLSAYPYLSETDVQYDEDEERLMESLQKRLHISPDQLNEILFLLLIKVYEVPEEDDDEIEKIIIQLEKDLDENRDYYSNIFK